MNAKLIVAFLVGAGFSLGLGLSHMTQPQTIIAFLDVLGEAWSYELLVVMFSAVATYAVMLRLMLKREKPVLAPRFMIPTRRDLTAPLFLGSATFGIGWGLSGLCPGPGLSALNTGELRPVLFLVTMTLGMWLQGRYADKKAALAAAKKQQEEAVVASASNPKDDAASAA